MSWNKKGKRELFFRGSEASGGCIDLDDPQIAEKISVAAHHKPILDGKPYYGIQDSKRSNVFSGYMPAADGSCSLDNDPKGPHTLHVEASKLYN